VTRLVFATRNRGKLAELSQLLADLPGLDLCSLDGFDVPEVIEDGDSFEANATKKAIEVSRATGLPALADDSGLEVDALDGDPGVRSARYAGEHASDDDNNNKLLAALSGVPEADRTAQFRSVLALADTRGRLGDGVIVVCGRCPGLVLNEPRGSGGFGYDPLFYVPELGATFAELGIGPKNDRSHRARAMAAMRPHLVDYFQLANPGRSG
jgi:XTP/dITP diphosphohydrolase